MLYTYNAYLRYSGTVNSPDECGLAYACTTEPPPAEPWPDDQWPYFLDDGWELVKVGQINRTPL